MTLTDAFVRVNRYNININMRFINPLQELYLYVVDYLEPELLTFYIRHNRLILIVSIFLELEGWS